MSKRFGLIDGYRACRDAWPAFDNAQFLAWKEAGTTHGKTVCYIAGPMRGVPEFNFPLFDQVADALRYAGWKNVQSPADMDRQRGDAPTADGSGAKPLAYYMEQDLGAVARSGAVFLLPGWRNSQGAKLEVTVALALDIPCIEVDTGEHIDDQWNRTFVEITPGLAGVLPEGSAARKAVPIATGVLDYFPAALVEVARVSKAGNDKHNPGQPLHHARGKSTDHADSLMRHMIDRGSVDEDTGCRHSAEVAWRALAMLQQELEDEGLAPLARGARLDDQEAS